MHNEVNQRQKEILNKYPSIKPYFEELYSGRCEEIIDELLKSDIAYKELNKLRGETSQEVLRIMNENGMADIFEAYSNAIFAEEVYELAAVYKAAFLDALELVARFA